MIYDILKTHNLDFSVSFNGTKAHINCNGKTCIIDNGYIYVDDTRFAFTNENFINYITNGYMPTVEIKCPFCGKWKSNTVWYDICYADDINHIFTSICEECFCANNGLQIYKKLGGIPCDSYNEGFTENILAYEKIKDYLDKIE